MLSIRITGLQGEQYLLGAHESPGRLIVLVQTHLGSSVESAVVVCLKSGEKVVKRAYCLFFVLSVLAHV